MLRRAALTALLVLIAASPRIALCVSNDEPASADFTVKVDGKPVFVHCARVSAVPFNQIWPGYQRPLDQTELASFASWEMTGPVTVEVLSHRPVNAVAVRPTSYGIRPAVKVNRIEFRMLRPQQVAVEVNGTSGALHLFGNPSEQNAPRPGDPQVRYFGPGVHEAGEIALKSGERVYIAAGAVVHGFITAVGAADIQILGRGVIDGSRYPRIRRFEGSAAIALHDCSNVKIEGPTLRDPSLWTLVVIGCRNVSIENVKLVGLWRYNSDGIDIVNSQDVSIARCFIRSFDDSICIKGRYPTRGYPAEPPRDISGEKSSLLYFYPERPVRNVTATGCVIWNDWGGALKFGSETWAPEMRNVVFQDCDIIHTGNAVMQIRHGDRAVISDVRFENIRVELDDEAYHPKVQCRRDEKYDLEKGPYTPTLLSLELVGSYYGNESYQIGGPVENDHGVIRNVLVKNVSVSGKRRPRSTLAGHDAAHCVENVTIENLRVQGKPVRTAEDGQFRIGSHVKNVKFVVGPQN